MRCDCVCHCLNIHSLIPYKRMFLPCFVRGVRGKISICEKLSENTPIHSAPCPSLSAWSTHGSQAGPSGWLYLSGLVPVLQCTYLQHTSVNFPSLQPRLGGLLAVAVHGPAPRHGSPGRGGVSPPPTLTHHPGQTRILHMSSNPTSSNSTLNSYILF